MFYVLAQNIDFFIYHHNVTVRQILYNEYKQYIGMAFADSRRQPLTVESDEL